MFRLPVFIFVASLVVSGESLPRKHPFKPARGRIVGGKTVNISEFPFQISLQELGLHNCGGTIISEDTVVTAAHCVEGPFSPWINEVVAGATDLSKATVRVGIASIKIHEGYGNLQNDIALIKLDQNLTFSEEIAAAKLPEESLFLEDNTLVAVSGYGVLTEDAMISPSKLYAVNITIVNLQACQNVYGLESVTSNQICAGVSEGGKDSCYGDSGGPLSLDGTLVGIVSWGESCAKKGYPGVYTRVNVYRSWIKENAGV